jgi:hypothetical protein
LEKSTAGAVCEGGVHGETLRDGGVTPASQNGQAGSAPAACDLVSGAADELDAACAAASGAKTTAAANAALAAPTPASLARERERVGAW